MVFLRCLGGVPRWCLRGIDGMIFFVPKWLTCGVKRMMKRETSTVGCCGCMLGYCNLWTPVIRWTINSHGDSATFPEISVLSCDFDMPLDIARI